MSDETTNAEPRGDEAAPSAEPQPVLSPKERHQVRRLRSRTERSPGTPEERRAARAQKAATRRHYRAKLKARRAATRAEAPAPAQQEAVTTSSGRPKVRQGVVVSAKADKTITVRIDVARRHRRYRKIMRSSTTLHVHDERNDANEGDTVRVVECRPMSRSKRWRLVEILERAR